MFFLIFFVFCIFLFLLINFEYTMIYTNITLIIYHLPNWSKEWLHLLFLWNLHQFLTFQWYQWFQTHWNRSTYLKIIIINLFLPVIFGARSRLLLVCSKLALTFLKIMGPNYYFYSALDNLMNYSKFSLTFKASRLMSMSTYYSTFLFYGYYCYY